LKGTYNDLKDSAYLKEVIAIHRKGLGGAGGVTGQKEEKRG
jgi:hypothetical protein